MSKIIPRNIANDSGECKEKFRGVYLSKEKTVSKQLFFSITSSNLDRIGWNFHNFQISSDYITRKSNIGVFQPLMKEQLGLVWKLNASKHCLPSSVFMPPPFFVILATLLSMFNCRDFRCLVFSRCTFLAAITSHAPHAT